MKCVRWHILLKKIEIVTNSQQEKIINALLQTIFAWILLTNESNL